MKIKDIIKVTNGKLIIGNEELECESFSQELFKKVIYI